MHEQGLLVVVSGPSGAGKGTVLKALSEENKNIRFSVSVTTREPRTGEYEGKSYFFKTHEEFAKMVENDELLEWVEYCDNYYGTPRQQIYENLEKGYDVILEIEVTGASIIKSKMPECVMIFIMPPSFGELRRRIESRGSEDSETILKRLEKAKNEIMFIEKYDYLVVNNDINEAVMAINGILATEKLKISRNLERFRKMYTDMTFFEK